MRSLYVIVLLLSGSTHLHAQLWDELFRQHKTQIKYSLKQIAALQLYTSYVEKGYRIAQDGLTFIGDVKQGQFDLDKNYFNALSAVNPSILKDERINAIGSYVQGIKQVAKHARRESANSKILAISDKEVIRKILDNAVSDGSVIEDQLSELLQSGEFQMSDNDRLSRIDQLYELARGLFRFVKAFTSSSRFYEAQTNKEKATIRRINQWYGLNK